MNRREAVSTALSNRQLHLSNVLDKEKDVRVLDEMLVESATCREVARKAANLVQDNLATRLSGIVTKALSTVFEEDIKFIAQFVERRGVSECDLFLKIGEHTYDILNEQGGGIADVCSMCLQMAFIMMSQVQRVLIIDEPARHMDLVAQERFIAVLSELCRELNFTIIMVTHSEAFRDGADKQFKVIKKGGISYVN